MCFDTAHLAMRGQRALVDPSRRSNEFDVSGRLQLRAKFRRTGDVDIGLGVPQARQQGANGHYQNRDG